MNSLARITLSLLILNSNLKIISTAENENYKNSAMDNVEMAGTTQTTSSNLSVSQKWEQMEQKLKISVRKMINFVLPSIMEFTKETNISAMCFKNVIKLINGLRDIKTWAMRFLDSSAKGIDGLLSGSMSSFGSFDECINTEVLNERKGRNYGEVLFRGKYCTFDIKPPQSSKKKTSNYHRLGEIPDELKSFSSRGTVVSDQVKHADFANQIPLRLGTCIPSGCSEEDLDQVLQQVSNSIIMTIKVKRCEMKEANQYSALQIAILSLFAFMGFLVVCGSLMDFYVSYTKQKYKDLSTKILLCFSFTKNLRGILSTKSSSSDIICLNGFRFLSMTWIIFGHSYSNANFHILREIRSILQLADDFAAQILINTMLAVDTFFFIGGMLICYHTIRKVKIANRPFSIPLYIVSRVFRILPQYLFVIAFVFLIPLMGSGPVWKDMIEDTVDPCYRSWWRNVIFINNFFVTNHMCMPHGWYIAADMQLYIVALVVLLPILKWPKIGFTISFIIILSSMVASAVVTHVMHFPPSLLYYYHFSNTDLTGNAVNYVYSTAYGHAGPYFVGVIVGYFLATKPKLQIPKTVQIVGWLLAITCNMSVIYGIYGWGRGKDPTDWEVIFYSGCHRTAWSLGVAWVIFCCQTGHGGVVNLILSWKAWIPLGRLNYLAFLFHLIILKMWMGSSRQGIQTSHVSLVWTFFGYLVATYGISLAAGLVIESPFLSLQKIILSTGKRKETNAQKNVVHEEKNGDNITMISISQKSATNGTDNACFEIKA